MFAISFDIDEPIESPDEYTMGFITIESDGRFLRSEEMSGRGMMMVFFSLASLLDAVVQLSRKESKDYRFVGEDSSFILMFKKTNQDSIQILKDKRVFCTISFNTFAKAVWHVSESLLGEYGDRIDSDNIAKKDWLSVREKALRICT